MSKRKTWKRKANYLSRTGKNKRDLHCRLHAEAVQLYGNGSNEAYTTWRKSIRTRHGDLMPHQLTSMDWLRKAHRLSNNHTLITGGFDFAHKRSDRHQRDHYDRIMLNAWRRYKAAVEHEGSINHPTIKAFLKANEESPVVSGAWLTYSRNHVYEGPDSGTWRMMEYELEDGRVFVLTRVMLDTIIAHDPTWKPIWGYDLDCNEAA